MLRQRLSITLGLLLLGCQNQPAPPVPNTDVDLGAATTSEIPASTPESATTPSSESAPPAEAAVKPPVAVDAPPALEAPSADGHNRLSREELDAGWLRLFDGHTLFGWTPNSPTNWMVAEGVISADGDEKGLLVTTTRWADYELRVDFRVSDGGNSGIFLRTPRNPASPVTDCYELNICDSHPEFKSASLVGRAQPTTAVTANGDWHTFHVTVLGPDVTVKLDHEVVLSYTDAAAAPLTSGLIGLQMNGGKAEFRNVFLKPLSVTDLFDGHSLAGWQVVPGLQSHFEVDEGTIRVTGGRGFLETVRTASNFVLQFEAITHGDALNSGVFFRAIPGTEKNPSDGYEFQVQSGFKNDDRNQPADFGTGAIFRRAPARRVISSDRQWLAATLVADGPHFTTWVDGVQVVDWTDDRDPHENPRQGLRLDAGHFSLQGHDPTTNLQFRKLRLANLP
ncbi:MAG: family 16 glycoside hydrolase [Planctomycetaceae bacterium]|nr:family 16 glycoside hydrolase [Planctomycetaceae bacterium]